MRFACDTGGTFTDLVVDDGGRLAMFKALTTPDDPVRGVFDALALAAQAAGEPVADYLARGEHFIHGTTRAINALVTGNTARTALLCTAGHPDTLLFREGGRADAFDYNHDFPAPLVPRSLTFEIVERVDARGQVRTALDEGAAVATIRGLADLGVEAVAVALLWSTVNPAHELRLGELLAEHLPGIPVTLSHAVNPSLREFRRTSSACIDASLKPLMTEYLDSLTGRLRDAGFGGRVLVLTSQGGMLDAADVAAQPIHSINSGPSMAPIAGRHHAQASGAARTAVIADTGGTTYDVSVVRDGAIPWTRESWIGPEYSGHLTGFPSVDVVSVGAGGGSIAWIDDGGLLCVGPQSASSVPGPACYGRGGDRPTVTDACALLGYLDPAYFLGGTMPLRLDAAEAAIRTHVAEPLGLGVADAAAGIVAIATSNMVHAIEDVTVDQGIDPAAAVLVGGGGAAGLNSVAIAAQLGCERVIFPEAGAALSASGALLSDIATDFAKTLMTSTAAFDFAGVAATLEELRERCAAFVERAGGAPQPVALQFEARYPGQAWEIQVPLVDNALRTPADVAALEQAFHDAHETLFAIADRGSPVEIVAWRATAASRVADGGDLRLAASADRAAATVGTRAVYFAQTGWVDAEVHHFEAVPETPVLGPAIIESPFTTIVVDPGARAHRTADGSVAVAPAIRSAA